MTGRVMTPRCVTVVATLSSRGATGLTPRMVGHIDRCERCHREWASTKDMEAGFARMRRWELVAPPDILPRVMADIGPWSVPDVAVRRRDSRFAVAAAATAAVATAATAAAGTVVLLLRARHRAA